MSGATQRPRPEADAPQVVVLTGVSGSGKSTTQAVERFGRG